MRSAILGIFALAALASVVASCSGSTTPADAGRKRDAGIDAGPPQAPTVVITATPTTGMVNEPVTFSAAITGGTPPYIKCEWRYSAGAEFAAGTITDSTCTGNHTYTMDADPYPISIEVSDSANRIGRANLGYTVGSTTTGMGVDYVVREIALVSAPTNNRYRPGQEMRVTFKVRNSGLGMGGASAAKVFLRRSVGGAETELGTVNVPAVNAQSDQSVNGTFTVPANQAVGAYDLKVVADVDNQVTELNEENNSAIGFVGIAIELPGDGG